MGILKYDNPKIKLKEIIFDSKLKENEKELWYDFIGQIIESDALSIIKVLEENFSYLDFLTKNLQDKLAAMNNKDKKMWGDIIKDEKDFIKSI